jgi:hypothetical protein
VGQYEPGSGGSGKSHCAQAIGHAVIRQGYRVLYREAHILLEELADATLDGNRKQHVELLTTVPLLIIDDLGMRKLPLTAAEELLEIIMRRYERASTPITSNGPVEDWGKLSRWYCRLRHAGSPSVPRARSQNAARAAGEPRPAVREKANDNSNGKTKAMRMAGKERPAASRLGIQEPPTPEPDPRNDCRNTKPSDSQRIGPTAEGLDYRFLRSQPRVIGHGSLRKARPRQSQTTIANTTSRAQS